MLHTLFHVMLATVTNVPCSVLWNNSLSMLPYHYCLINYNFIINYYYYLESVVKSSVTKLHAMHCHICQTFMVQVNYKVCKRLKVKLAHTRLPNVGFRSWSRFLAVSLQVTWVINPVVGCHYFLPGLQLPSQPLRGLLPVLLLGEQRHDGCEQFA